MIPSCYYLLLRMFLIDTKHKSKASIANITVAVERFFVRKRFTVDGGLGLFGLQWPFLLGLSALSPYPIEAVLSKIMAIHV